MRRDEIQDVKDPGCRGTALAMLGILVGVVVAIGTMFYGVVYWPW